jgi:MoxR-like ATPase
MVDGEGSAAPRSLKTKEFVEKVRRLRDALGEGLVERDVPVRLALLAALSGEHLLLVGPPGTAKSLIARRLHLAFEDATYFERLLTRFTVPEELFGPLSIKGLEQDRYERLTQAYLPKASIAFLDEIFKSNSAILNALLTLLNEREFDNGAVRDKTPLVAVIGASNELPEGEELEALFDRFLLRLHVPSVSDGGFRALLALRGQTVPEIARELKLTKDELTTVQGVAEVVEVPDDVVALLCDLRKWCIAEKIRVSDRRWRKIVKLLQVSAVTNGRSHVSIWDCWLLQHCLWDEADARQKVYDWYAARVGASAAMDPSRLTKIIVSWEARLKADRESRSQMMDAARRLLYRDSDGKLKPTPNGSEQAFRDGAPLFLAPDRAQNGSTLLPERTNGGSGYLRSELDKLNVWDKDRWTSFRHWQLRDEYLAEPSNWHKNESKLQPALEPTRHKRHYIDGSIRDVDEIRAEIDLYRKQLTSHIASLDAEIRSHLWVQADFALLAKARLEESRHEVERLLERLVTVRRGYRELPCEDLPEQNPLIRGAG